MAPPLPTGEGVGTGVSCGVDSLHAIHKFIDYPIKRNRLTHLCINDVGAFGNHLYWRVGGSKVRDNSYARARKVAAEVGLPLIETESNVANALRLNHIMTHTFSSLFSIMCMRKLWGVYYYASAGYDTLTDISLRNWTRKHPADYEPILLRMMNTPGLMFYSAGELETRMEKIADIANYDVARKHLFSCTWDLENCGVCKKCTRNLTTLDYLGKLSNFSESYNIPHYMVHREYHFWRMYNNQSDHFFKATESWNGSDEGIHWRRTRNSFTYQMNPAGATELRIKGMPGDRERFRVTLGQTVLAEAQAFDPSGQAVITLPADTPADKAELTISAVEGRQTPRVCEVRLCK